MGFILWNLFFFFESLLWYIFISKRWYCLWSVLTVKCVDPQWWRDTFRHQAILRQSRAKWWLSNLNVITSEHWFQGFPSQGIKGFPSPAQCRKPVSSRVCSVYRNWIVLHGECEMNALVSVAGTMRAMTRDGGRITRWNSLHHSSDSSPGQEERGGGESRARTESQVGSSERAFFHPYAEPGCASGQWLTRVYFLIYNLNECNISFKRRRLGNDATACPGRVNLSVNSCVFTSVWYTLLRFSACINL